MNEELIESVKEWLEDIMPSVVENLTGEVLTPETLSEMGKEQAIHGPITIDLEEFAAPITAINFFVMVQSEVVLLATTSVVKDAPEDFNPPIQFGSVFTIDKFAKEFVSKNNQKRLVKDLVEQYKSIN